MNPATLLVIAYTFPVLEDMSQWHASSNENIVTFLIKPKFQVPKRNQICQNDFGTSCQAPVNHSAECKDVFHQV